MAHVNDVSCADPVSGARPHGHARDDEACVSCSTSTCMGGLEWQTACGRIYGSVALAPDEARACSRGNPHKEVLAQGARARAMISRCAWTCSIEGTRSVGARKALASGVMQLKGGMKITGRVSRTLDRTAAIFLTFVVIDTKPNVYVSLSFYTRNCTIHFTFFLHWLSRRGPTNESIRLNVCSAIRFTSPQAINPH